MKKPIAALLFLVVSSLHCASVWATTYYVNGTTGDDSWYGLSAVWDGTHGPKKTIQAGIDASADTDTVIVADGTYTGDENRRLEFLGKAITVRSENGPECTMIDCEDDGFAVNFEDLETSATVLRGFTVRNASQAGIICSNISSPTIMDCIIKDNETLHQGGGINCRGSGDPTIIGCLISGNSAGSGGGIYCDRGNPTIIGCTITGNAGGGIRVNESIAVIADCTINNNAGSGISCGSGVLIRDCLITGNSSLMNGGGILCGGSSTIASCVIRDNIADDEGGGIYCGGDAIIVNCTIMGNVSGEWGGGLFCHEGTPLVTNCTFLGNRATAGGGIHCLNCSPTFEYCILWGNTPDEISAPGQNPTVTYCDVQGGWTGEGNIDCNPLLTPDGHLTRGSRCIDSCPGGAATDRDGESRPYPTAGSFDMGADEFIDTDEDLLPDYWELKYFGSTAATNMKCDEDSDWSMNLMECMYGTNPLELDTDGDGRVDTTEFMEATNPLHPDNTEKTYYLNAATGDDSWDGLAAVYDGIHGPRRTVQGGINAAITGWGYTVLAASGTYSGQGNRRIDFRGKEIVLKGAEGAEETVIDADSPAEHAYPCFEFDSAETESSIVLGFTIRGGANVGRGGAFYFEGTSPTVRDCRIVHNSSGAIDCESSAPTFVNCTIADNYVDSGSTITCREGTVLTMIDCIVRDNTAYWEGGGISCDRSSLTLDGCTISNHDGTGIYAGNGGVLRITNCLVSGNVSSQFAGGIWCETDDAVIAGCTITGNHAGWEGGGILCHFSDPLIANCVIRNNRARGGGGLQCTHSSAAMNDCVITGNYATNGGGIGCEGYGPRITNCLVANNAASEYGGGVFLSRSHARTYNTSICDNLAGMGGGGVCCDTSNYARIIDSILWGNSAPQGHEVYLSTTLYPSELMVSYSNVQGGAEEVFFEPGCKPGWVEGNISDDPLFVRGPLHDYYLSQVASGQGADSPCVDAGSDTAANLSLGELSTRTDGLPDAGIVDMGYHALYALWICGIERSGDDVTIYWNALPGVSYVVQWSTDMEMWNDVPVGETDNWTDIGALETIRFYRVFEQ